MKIRIKITRDILERSKNCSFDLPDELIDQINIEDIHKSKTLELVEV